MTNDQFDTLIDAIVSGSTLKQAIAEAETSWRALQLLIAKDDTAASRYARARSDSAHFYADKAQEAVEAARDNESAAVGRIRAEVYKWRAAMANPREYGDRATVEHTGSVGHHLDTVERDARLGSILGGIETRLITAQATVIPDEMTDPEPENAENRGKTPEPQPAKAKRGDTKATPKRQ